MTGIALHFLRGLSLPSRSMKQDLPTDEHDQTLGRKALKKA